MKTNFKS